MLTSMPSTTNLRVLLRVLLCSLESWPGGNQEAKLSLSAKNPWVTWDMARSPPGPTASAPPSKDMAVHHPLASSFSVWEPECVNLSLFFSLILAFTHFPLPSPT